MSARTSSSTTTQSGRILAQRYHLHRCIGEGGMGAVYEAEDELTHERVAIKLLHPRHLHRGNIAARFVREARSASAIGHESIIKIFDEGQESDGTHFLVMEYLQGMSLGEWLKSRHQLSEDETLALLVQLLDGLEAAHHAGIVHRDLKPENLFLVRQEGGIQLKILDFGISKMLDQELVVEHLTRTGEVLGTPLYLAPEQARGERDVDQQVDIWAVGVTLYQMLSGRLPFWGENYNSLMFQILSAEPPQIRDLVAAVSEDMAGAIHGCLAKDRTQRFASVEALRQALARRLTERAEGGASFDDWPAAKLAHDSFAQTGDMPGLRTAGTGLPQTALTPPPQFSPAPFALPATPPQLSSAPFALPATSLHSLGSALHLESSSTLVRPVEGISPVPPGKPSRWKSIVWWCLVAPVCGFPLLLMALSSDSSLWLGHLMGASFPSPLWLRLLFFGALGGWLGWTAWLLWRSWAGQIPRLWPQRMGALWISGLVCTIFLLHTSRIFGQSEGFLAPIFNYAVLSPFQAAEMTTRLQQQYAHFKFAFLFSTGMFVAWVWLHWLAHVFLHVSTQRVGRWWQRFLWPGLGVLVLLSMELFFSQQLQWMGYFRYLLYLCWFATAWVALGLARSALPAQQEGAWRITSAGAVLCALVISLQILIGYFDFLWIGLTRAEYSIFFEAYAFRAYMGTKLQQGALLELGLLLGLFLGLFALLMRMLPWRGRDLFGPILVNTVAVLLAVVPVFVLFSLMEPLNDAWLLPRKVSQMVPVSLSLKARPSFYIDPHPQGLWVGRKLLWSHLTGQPPWRYKKSSLLRVLRGSQRCRRQLAHALREPRGRKHFPAPCLSPQEASAYCRSQGKQLPTAKEWLAALATIPPSKRAPVSGQKLLVRLPGREWVVGSTGAKHSFALQDHKQTTPLRAPAVAAFSPDVFFRCILRISK